MTEPFIEFQLPEEKKRMKWRLKLFVLVLLIVFFPVIDSYVECPFMPYYRWSNPKKTSFMKYRETRAKEKGEKLVIRYKPVKLSAISKTMQKAVVVAEDAHFYEHDGLDFDAIEKAYEYNKRKGKPARGGSTISQQLAKNLWLSPERSFYRKLVEAILTFRMEFALPKERILELYLNSIEFGKGVFGIAAASEYYFGTSPANLSAEQAATLTAIIPAPLRSGPGRLTGTAERRKGRILMALIGKKAFEEFTLEEEQKAAEAAQPSATPKPAGPIAW